MIPYNKNSLILAPMAGITDLPFRSICKKYSNPGLVVTEMVSSKALFYNDEKTKKLLNIKNEKRPIAFQIFGSDPEVMGKTAKEISENAVPMTIMDNETPKAPAGTWALINLLSALATALLSLIMMIGYFRARREENEEMGEDSERNNKGILRFASLIPAIAAIAAEVACLLKKCIKSNAYSADSSDNTKGNANYLPIVSLFFFLLEQKHDKYLQNNFFAIILYHIFLKKQHFFEEF